MTNVFLKDGITGGFPIYLKGISLNIDPYLPPVPYTPMSSFFLKELRCCPVVICVHTVHTWLVGLSL